MKRSTRSTGKRPRVFIADSPDAAFPVADHTGDETNPASSIPSCTPFVKSNDGGGFQTHLVRNPVKDLPEDSDRYV
jgi:hypothetical protein